MSNTHIVRKVFAGYPCAHRQHLHPGHCAYVHGYSRTFILHFKCVQLSPEGFVIDFGELEWVKDFLDRSFDHTCLINLADPLLDEFKRLHTLGALKLVVLPNVGMEGSSRYVYHHLEPQLLLVPDYQARGVRLVKVECHENDKNSASYEP